MSKSRNRAKAYRMFTTIDYLLDHLITCFKAIKEIEIKQQDKYCTVKETIQFRPATYDELRRQLGLRSDSLGAVMKSNDAGYVHAKDNKRKVSCVHVIKTLKSYRKVIM